MGKPDFSLEAEGTIFTKLAYIVLLLLLLLLPMLPGATEAAPDADIRDLRGPTPPSRFPPFAATVTLLIAVGFFMKSRHRTTKAVTAAQPECEPLTQQGTLIRQLENSRQQQLPPEELIERLMPIIRGFLAERIESPVGHLTSEELIAALQRRCDYSPPFQEGTKGVEFPPPFQGEGRGGDGVDCDVSANAQYLPHPHPNLPLEGEGTKGEDNAEFPLEGEGTKGEDNAELTCNKNPLPIRGRVRVGVGVGLGLKCRSRVTILTALLHLCDDVRFGAVSPTVEQAEWALTETMLLLLEHTGEAS